ncbi:hypothetical protein D3C85_1906200 [compost metagenome]
MALAFQKEFVIIIKLWKMVPIAPTAVAMATADSTVALDFTAMIPNPTPMYAAAFKS